MKTIIIRSVSIFAISFGLTMFSAAFIPGAYAQSQEFPNTNTQQQSNFSSSACNSVPPARPTGAATLRRLEALQECYRKMLQGSK
ncbi:hypothetical protein CAL7716_103390 (plasmid) [Calothrix sp. PCC 7716]|nr:hypothetical protein CAL7716_103390 [Calothrix sp. PCC 7716]